MTNIKGKHIFVVNRLVSQITGLNQAMLQRARLFTQYLNQEVSILTLRFDPKHYNVLEEKLLKQNKINHNINIINMYEYFKGEIFSEIPVRKKEDTEDYFIEKKKNAYRYFLHGNYVKYEKYDEEGLLERTDYYNDNRYCYKSEEYDQKGNIVRVMHKDLINGEIRNDVYYRSNGSIYLTKWYQWNNEKKSNRLLRINLFDNNGNIIKVVHSENELKYYFFDCIINNEKSFMIAEARSVDDLIANYKNDKVSKLAIIHNMHLEAPFNIDSEINKSHKALFKSVAKFDGVVILTEKQKKDIEEKIGAQKNFFVIPHANSTETNLKKSIGKKNRKIVIVARLAKQKQLDHAILAMKKVLGENPNVSLHIFGEGKEKQFLNELITRHNIEKNVFLEGYTTNPIKEYANADLSLLTSDYEGFGLVILESLSQGCPVISYDLKYGPSDMIIDGYNGFLVENKNIDQLASKITDVLNDESMLSYISGGAVASIERFSEKTFVEKWCDVFKNIAE